MSKVISIAVVMVLFGCSGLHTTDSDSMNMAADGTVIGDVDAETDASGPDMPVRPTDISPPSWPLDASLKALSQSETHVVLSWTEASDESGIAAYLIVQDNEEIARVDNVTTVLKVYDLTENTSYSFRVEAEDGAGNRSDHGPRWTRM